MMYTMKSVIGDEITEYAEVNFGRTVLINALPTKEESEKERHISLLKTEKQR